MEDKFSLSEFTGAEGSIDANTRFRNSHDPRLGYIYTQKLLETVDNEVGSLEDDDQEKAKAYSRVAVFREAVQYIEEFGIYLYSELDEGTDFVDTLVRTNPSEIKPLFADIVEDSFDSALNERVDDSEEWLKELLGYDLLEQNNVDISDVAENPEDLTVDSRSDAVQNSLSSAKSKIEHIAEFFTRFSEPYNAIKHGNRVSIHQGFQGTTKVDDGEHILDIDEPMAEFLCKKSGDHGGGRPYVFLAPAQMLSERAAAIVEITNEVYEGIYKMERSIANAEDAEPDEITTYRYTFYDITEPSSNEVSHQFTSVESPDVEIWIPEEYAPEVLESAPGELQTHIAVACRYRNGGLVIETELDSTTSDEYPLLVESTLDTDKVRLARSIQEHNFDIDLQYLPVWQYREFRRLESAGPFNSLQMEIDTGDEITRETYRGDIDLPPLPDTFEDDHLDFLTNVGRATGAEMLTPLYLDSEDVDLMNEYIDNGWGPDEADEFLSEMETRGTGRHYTIINLFLMDKDSTAQNGYRCSQRVSTTGYPGTHTAEIDEEEQKSNISYIGVKNDVAGDLDDQEVLYAGTFEEGQSDVFEMLVDDPQDWAQVMDEFTETRDPGMARCFVEINRQEGSQLRWYKLYTINILVLDEVPSYFEEAMQN